MFSAAPLIYADHNSTSPIYESARLKMLPYLKEEFGNPSSISYPLGQSASNAVEEARQSVASFLGASPSEVVFLSGGSESCFQAVFGSLLWHSENKKGEDFQFISSLAEHSAVYESIKTARSFFDCEEKSIALKNSGALQLENLEELISDKQSFLSVMAANNETGVCYSFADIASSLDSQKVIFHSDLIQFVGKKNFNFKDSGLDLASISSHKIGGPKGIGALVIKEGSRWIAPMQSGGQEGGRRGGTLAVANIVGFGEAARIKQEMLQTEGEMSLARDRFESLLRSEFADAVSFIGDSCQRLCNTSNVIFEGVAGTDLVDALAKKNICISKGSACSAAEGGLSRVHLAMGLSERESRCSVRISFAVDASEKEADLLAEEIISHVVTLRREALSEVQNLIS